MSNSADAIFASILSTIQARRTVAEIIEVNALFVDASAEGAERWSQIWKRDRDGRGFPSRRFAEKVYREAWAIYSVCFATSIRREFEALFGSPFGDFENAVDSMGWILATPEAQARAWNSPATILTPGDLAHE
ncbi:MAG: hypothetical protein ACOZAA_09625 [Pseudomonadota bacterium]